MQYSGGGSELAGPFNGIMIIVTAAVVVKFSEPMVQQPDSKSDCSTALRLAAPFDHQSVSDPTQAAG